MRLTITFGLIALMLCSSCAKNAAEAPFDYFVFSYSAETINYSVKFTNSDTAYFQLRYPNEEERYALLKKSGRDTILALIREVRFNDSDTIYYNEQIEDGTVVKFFKRQGNAISSVHNYEVKDPDKLLDLGNRFDEFIMKLTFYPSEKKQDYGDLSNIELPPPPPVEIREVPKITQKHLHIE